MTNPYISLLKTSWHYARRERKKMAMIYAMFIVANVIFSLNPLLLGWFIGKAQADFSQVWTYSLYYVGAYISLKLIEWCFHGPARIMERNLAFNISRNFMQEKFHQTLHLTAKWHQDHHSGATINRIRKAYEALRGFFDTGFGYVYTLTKFVFSVSAILYFSPLFGSIAVGMGLITIFMISKFDKPFISTLREVNEKEHEVSSNLFDTLSNVRTVITLRLERSMERGLLSKVKLVSAPFRRNAITNEWKWFVAEMMITLIYGVIVIGFVHQNWVPGKAFQIAGLVTLLGFVNQFTSVFQNVASQYTNLVQFNTNLQGAAEITSAYQTKHRSDQPEDLPPGWATMEIKKLNFSHRPSYDAQYSPQSLHDLNLRINRGQKIALIGESGSGKSTLLSLLRGLYLPSPGSELRIDAEPYTIESIHDTATLFPQDPEIFENTMEYNITLGLPCTREEINEVCEIAHLTEVIRTMPEGLKTDIREKGVNLSGGQKQRLALARGILAARDSQLILLDEPTSSVDPTSEVLIYQKLFARFREKSMISSLHRLHLLEQFDYIYILEKGRIIDQGNFDYLLANSEPFQRMWAHQKARALAVA